MAYGLSAINSSDYVQIDDNYSNYVVKSSGTVVTASSSPYIASIPLPSGYTTSDVLIFIRPSLNVYVMSIGPDANSDPQIATDTASSSVKYVILVKSDSLSAASTYGIEIYKTDSTLVWSSEYTPLNIRVVWNITFSSSVQTFTAPSPNTGLELYYCLTAVINSDGLYYPGGAGYWIVPTVKCTSSTGFSGIQDVLGGAPPVNQDWTYRRNILIGEF